MIVYLSLGTNIDDRLTHINQMLKETQKLLQQPFLQSPLMETEPVGTPMIQQWFYNMIVCGVWHGSLQELLIKTQQIERSMGRSEKANLQPRTADIDILLAESVILNEPGLIIPHYQLVNRRFCIEGICTIDPHAFHPQEKKTFSTLKQEMNSTLLQQKLNLL